MELQSACRSAGRAAALAGADQDCAQHCWRWYGGQMQEGWAASRSGCGESALLVLEDCGTSQLTHMLGVFTGAVSKILTCCKSASIGN